MTKNTTGIGGPSLWIWLPAAAVSAAAGMFLPNVYSAVRWWFIFAAAWLLRTLIGAIEARGRPRAGARLAAHAAGALLLLAWAAFFSVKNRDALLCGAAMAGNEIAVRLAARAGANPDARGAPDESSPLTHAVLGYNVSMTGLLLDLGASPNAADRVNGYTALMKAANVSSRQTAQLLLERGADVNAASFEGNTALMYASAKGDQQFAAMLVERGADVNAADNRQRTALMYAAREGRIGVIGALLAAKAAAGAKDADGKTAADYAAMAGHERTAELLLAAAGETLKKPVETTPDQPARVSEEPAPAVPESD